MDTRFDINVDYDVLCAIEDKLKKIGYNLSNSTEKMLMALQSSQGFLAGNQFEKAKHTTMKCIEVTGRTSNNLRNAGEYIEELRRVYGEYSSYMYTEE